MTTAASELQSSSTALLTFLIADVRGYTRFVLERGDETGARLAMKFAAVAREVVDARQGRVIELRGDEALAVFESARQALRAASELQERFAAESRLQPELPLPVGIGVDAGEAIPVELGYRGAALNLAARLCALAGHGEVLASDTVVKLARKLDGLAYIERGPVQLKGFDDPVMVVQVMAATGNEPVVTSAIEQRLPIGGFLGALPAGSLVAREEQMQRILPAIDAVSGGAGRMVVLGGEAGVGKTRLAQEATLEVRNRGFLVATGSCYAPEGATPFYPFLDALAAVYAVTPADIQGRVASEWPLLPRLLPTRAAAAPATSFDSREEQQRLFWAVTGFLQAVAERAPVAMLLDDLHWADGSSLSLLQHLARHTRSHRILLLGTFRDNEVGRQHPLEVALLDLTRQGLVERISVPPLREEGTARLVAEILGAQDVSGAFSALLHGRTEGNPFFVQEVLRALVERGDVYREEGRWERRALDEIEVPETVRAVVAQRLSHLSEGAQEIICEASVLGQTFRFDDLAVLRNDRGEEALEKALEEGIGAGLVRETGPDTYSFHHALTRQALYAELSSRRKRRLHLAMGDALERMPEQVQSRRLAELAEHFVAGGDTERALRYTMLVGDRAAAVFAHDDAARSYQLALDLAQQSGDAGREAEASEKLGSLLTATIRYDEALWMLERAAYLFRTTGNREDEGRVVAQIGRVHFSTAANDQGIARLEPAVDALSAGGSARALAGVTSVLGKLYYARGRYDRALEAAERAAQLARDAGDGGVLAEAEITRGTSLAMLGRWSEGLRVLDPIVPAAESVGDLFSVARALQNAAAIYLARGDAERHGSYMERALEVARRMGNQRQIAATTFGLSVNAFVRGNWARAHEEGDRSLEVMNVLSATWRSAFHLAGLGALATAEGEWTTADRYLDECIAVSEEIGDVQTLQAAQEVLAEKELLQGEPERARERLEAMVGSGGADSPAGVGLRIPGHYVIMGTHHAMGLLPLLARTYVETGDLDRAHALAAAGIALAIEEELNLVLAEWRLVEGAVLAGWARWDDATRALTGAIGLSRTIPYPYGEGRGLHALGEMEAARNHIDEACRQLEAALAVFRTLGARPYALEIERALADLSNRRVDGAG